MSALLDIIATLFRIVFRLSVWCAIVFGMLLHAAFGNSAGRD